MQPSPEPGGAPIQYEALQQTDNTLGEIQNVGDFAVGHLAFLANRTDSSTEVQGMNQESKVSFASLQFLRDLPQYENGYSEPIPVTNDAKGMLPNGNDLFIQIDESNPDQRTVQPAIKPEQPDENTPLPDRILTINGSNNNNFTCVVETGAGEKRIITLPRKVVEDAQVLSQREEIVAGITDEQVRKVVQAQIDVLLGNEPSEQIDRQTLVEAAKSSGQVTTESLNKFLDNAAPEKPDDEEFNNRRQAIKDTLSNHTVATSEDFISVLTFAGPEKVIQAKEQLLTDIANKEQEIKQQSNPEEQAILKQELDDLNTNLTDLANAEAFYADPKNFETFVDIMSSGKITKEQATIIEEHFENGEMVKAMQEMAKAKIESLTPEQQKQLAEKFSLSNQDKLLLASGGTLLALMMLFLGAITDNKA